MLIRLLDQNAIPCQRATQGSGRRRWTDPGIENHVQQSGAVIHPNRNVGTNSGDVGQRIHGAKPKLATML